MKLKLKPRVILSVDPGVTTAGVAVWDAKKFRVAQADWRRPTPRPERARSWTLSRRSDDSVEATCDAVDGLLDEIQRWVGDQVVVKGIVAEWMHVWATSATSLAAAADLLAIQFMVGRLAQWAREAGTFQPAPVPKWKGNMNKPKVVSRIESRYEEPIDWLTRPMAEHDWDAVGIGLWAMGRL